MYLSVAQILKVRLMWFRQKFRDDYLFIEDPICTFINVNVKPTELV